jgi:septal ring factor EnvC (AmiA/AmiB activator)
MTTLEDVIAQQCEIIGELMADADEVRALAEADGFDTDGSLRGCYMQLQEERDETGTKNSALQKEIEAHDEAMADLMSEIKDLKSQVQNKIDCAEGDISDALSDLCIALGYAARPIRLTGIPELDALVRAVWG